MTTASSQKIATNKPPVSKRLLKPTVTLVLSIDEPITIKNLSLYLKHFLLGGGTNDWITQHLKNVRVRSIDFD